MVILSWCVCIMANVSEGRSRERVQTMFSNMQGEWLRKDASVSLSKSAWLTVLIALNEIEDTINDDSIRIIKNEIFSQMMPTQY